MSKQFLSSLTMVMIVIVVLSDDLKQVCAYPNLCPRLTTQLAPSAPLAPLSESCRVEGREGGQLSLYPSFFTHRHGLINESFVFQSTIKILAPNSQDQLDDYLTYGIQIPNTSAALM